MSVDGVGNGGGPDRGAEWLQRAKDRHAEKRERKRDDGAAPDAKPDEPGKQRDRSAGRRALLASVDRTQSARHLDIFSKHHGDTPKSDRCTGNGPAEGDLEDRFETNFPGGGASDPSRATTDPGQPFRRLLPSAYADGDAAPSGADLPGARAISNAVSAETGQSAPANGPTDLFWAFGQFIDHDIDLTEGGAHGEGESMPIEIPVGDPTFDPDGAGDQTLSFTRSGGVENPFGARQQINAITALIDASNIYGSTPDETAALREGDAGLMLMGSEDDLGWSNLPKDASGQFYQAGDVRANENAALTSLHTVFAREHNRLAEEIMAENPDWTGDQVFDAAREIVTAELQAITVNEFLPVLLGEGALGEYEGHTGVDAQISNSFATAAFRFGHSMVSESLKLVDEDGVETDVPLSEAFFNPAVIETAGVEDVLRGLTTQLARPLDMEIVDSLRNLVLSGPGSPRLDLAALNIQRGRDHGLPSLNAAREGLGLDPLTGFDDPRLRDGAGERLAAVYASIDDVDLWVGMLAEEPVGDGLVGETQRIVLLDQFSRLRDGDADWYEGKFTADEVAAFDAQTLTDIIERNSPTGDLQQYGMLAS